MSDLTEVVIVTAAAAAALGILLWPLVPRGKAQGPAKPGCASCEKSPVRAETR